MSIIEKTSELREIRTQWDRQDGTNGIAEVMARKTKLKKVIFYFLKVESYNILKNIIDPEWHYEGDVYEYKREATFIWNENNF